MRISSAEVVLILEAMLHILTFSFPGYLKLWQLQTPKPQLHDKYDVLFIDEAQDCTPGNDAGLRKDMIMHFFCACDGDGLFPSSFAAIMDVLMSQRCGKILVGDPHQQIYTFKGAVNALNLLDHTHIFYLTQVLEISQSKRRTFAKKLLKVVRVVNIWKETSFLFLQ